MRSWVLFFFFFFFFFFKKKKKKKKKKNSCRLHRRPICADRAGAAVPRHLQPLSIHEHQRSPDAVSATERRESRIGSYGRGSRKAAGHVPQPWRCGHENQQLDPRDPDLKGRAQPAASGSAAASGTSLKPTGSSVAD